MPSWDGPAEPQVPVETGNKGNAGNISYARIFSQCLQQVHRLAFGQAPIRRA